MLKYLMIISLSLTQIIHAQTWQSDYDKGEQAYKDKAYKKAVNYLSRARFEAKKNFGEDSPKTLKTAELLAQSYTAIQDYQGAISVYKSIVEAYKNLDNTNTLAYAQLNLNIGSLYGKRSRYKNAVTYMKQGLSVIKRLEGTRSLTYINAYITYIDLYIDGGALEKAQEYTAQLLPIAKTTLGVQAKIYLNLLYKKMLIYKNRKKYSESIQAGQEYIQACQVAKELKQAYNKAYLDLALAHRKLKDTANMLVNYKTFLTNQRSIYGTNEVYLANLDNAILVYEASGLQQPAIELLKERLDLESNSKNNPNTIIDLLLNLSKQYIKVEQYDSALESILKAQEIAKTKKEVDKLKYISTLYALSDYYMTRQDLAKASQSLEKTLDFIKNQYGENYPSYGEYALKACQYYFENGKLDKAKQLAEHVAQVYKKNKKEKHHIYGDSYKILAQITVEKDLKTTREYLKIMTASYSAYYGFASKQYFEANEWLADLEVELDNKPEAKRLYTQLLTLSNRIYGVNSKEYQRINKKIKTTKK